MKRFRHHTRLQRPKELCNLDVLADGEASSVDEIKTPKKKAKHEDETENQIQEFATPNTQKRRTSNATTKPNENLQKTLTWRSPLITSPTVKYSPNLENNFVGIRENINPSASRWGKNDATPVRGNKSDIRFSIR